MSKIEELFDILSIHDEQEASTISLVSSEMPISPLAKDVFGSNAYARYAFDNMNQWGTWAFPGGNGVGKIEHEILIPLLKEMAKAQYINVKPISGLNCMFIVIASYCKQGDTICLMPENLGGHPSSIEIANSLGLEIIYFPEAKDEHEVDWEAFTKLLKEKEPRLVYIDQATVLFPVEIDKVRRSVDEAQVGAKIHLDSSHLNGLILGEVFGNPLDLGADSFGGSTHKTLPGPHKAFLATNDSEINDAFAYKSAYLTSHHHMAEVIALAVTLIEFKERNGHEYAHKVVENAKHLAFELSGLGFDVQAKDKGFTACHQLWIDPSNYVAGVEGAKLLFESGIILNTYRKMPYMSNPAYRLGVNEITRYGMGYSEIKDIAEIFKSILIDRLNTDDVRQRVKELKQRHREPLYCYEKDYMKKALLA